MSQSPPPDLSLWSLHCFCLKARASPKRVIDLDNNGQILFQAIGGTNLSEMRQNGMSVNESQLALMQNFGLIEWSGEQVTTTIPVLGPDAISLIRVAVAKAAQVAVADVSDAAKDIVAKLALRGLEASSHAIVFGHALDGVVWGLLAQHNSLPEIELTVDQPFWRGALWAVYPGVAGSAGTNELTEANNSLVMVWDDESAASLHELESLPGTPRMLQAMRPGIKQISLDSISGGQVVVPVITREDEIHLISLTLADAVVDAMPDSDRAQALLGDAGVDASAGEAMVIVAHEMIWKLALMLTESNVIEPPQGPDPAGRVFVRVDP